MHDIISCQAVLLWRVSVSAHDLKGNKLIVEFGLVSVQADGMSLTCWAAIKNKHFSNKLVGWRLRSDMKTVTPCGR